MKVGLSSVAGAVGEGTSALGATSWWQDIVGDVTDIVGSRWGTQRGTYTQVMPDGTRVEVKQPQSVPVAGPLQFGANLSADQSAGVAAGAGIALVVGVGLVMVMMMSQRR